jgi:8-oxo-dGTP pyrophosphatase MutT (NUDIX family)
MSPEPAPNLQYAALPYRRRADSTIEVMLITSRETGRWVIPKGWPKQRLRPPDLAAREAMEEAGLAGRIGDRSIGFYHYKKRLADGSAVPCAVETFRSRSRSNLPPGPSKTSGTPGGLNCKRPPMRCKSPS